MRILMILGCLLVVAGCDSHVVPPSTPKVEVPAQDRLFDSQRHALEQTKVLSDKVEQDAVTQQKIIDQQTQ